MIAPPYDVLSTAEAREAAAGRPHSFLHVSKPEIDLPPDTDPFAPAVYAKARENLLAMLHAGILVRDAAPHFYVYRLTGNGHTQTGLVAGASVADYDRGRIRRHEFTRPDKEDDRVRQIEAAGAQTGPALLACPDSGDAESLLARMSEGEPAADALAPDGVRHQLWVVNDADALDAMANAFEAMPGLYIADGHHRTAAASRIAARRRAAGAGDGDPSQAFLAVVFPARSLRILPYNRVVADLGGRTSEAFIEALRRHCVVESSDAPVSPSEAGTFGMYVAGRWYRARFSDTSAASADAIGALDVSRLAAQVLEPLLGITDPRRDPRIDFVGGGRGLVGLVKRVDSGEMACAFSMFPTPMPALMAVADAGQVMPPKSTWFEPKLADGMVSLPLEDAR